MKTEILLFLILGAMPLAVLTIWFATAALLVRPFGIRVPILIWRSMDYRNAVQRLSRIQYLAFPGVLGFGVGVGISDVLAGYTESWLRVGHPLHESIGRVAFHIVWFALPGGICWGWLTWKYSSPDYDPFSGNDALSITSNVRKGPESSVIQ